MPQLTPAQVSLYAAEREVEAAFAQDVLGEWEEEPGCKLGEVAHAYHRTHEGTRVPGRQLAVGRSCCVLRSIHRGLTWGSLWCFLSVTVGVSTLAGRCPQTCVQALVTCRSSPQFFSLSSGMLLASLSWQ